MKAVYLFALLLFATFFSVSTNGQPSLGTWQWAKQGGGVFNTTFGENEVVNDICTDKYGNVYVTGIVYQDPYFEGVRYTAPFASFGSSDAFVAKYDKCSHLKWVRFGGGIAQDVAEAIHVDDSLNVYITGFIGSYNPTFPDSTHIDSLSGAGFFWTKYDSIGNVKWAHVSHKGDITNAPSKLIARPDGNLSIVIGIDTGAFYPNFTPGYTTPGDAIFEFDLNGNPVSLNSIDSLGFNTNYSNLNFGDIAYDSKGNIVLIYSIYDTAKIFDTILYTPSGDFRTFILKANPQTHRIIWIKEWQEDQFQSSEFGVVLVDKADNIIAGGNGGVNSVFNGDSIMFNTAAALDMAVVFKLDSNGNTLWYNVANATDNANGPINLGALTLYGDQYIGSIINVSGPTYWGGDTFNSIGTNPQTWTLPDFITFTNTNTGKVEFGDSLAAAGSSSQTTVPGKLISDQQGNVYIGGYFSGELEAGPDTIYPIGGINDAFVMKWGLPCPDTTALIAPLAAEGLVAYASSLHAIDVNWQNVAQYADRYRIYRSTTDSLTGYSLIDSVSKYTNQYTDVNVVSNQIYWYRVSAVNGAGETFSNSDSAVIIPTGISDLNTDIRHISLYPNPANNYTELSVWSDASSSIAVTISIADMEGREFYNNQTDIAQGKNDFVINLASMNAGVYIINLHTDNGTYAKRLVIVK